MIIKYSEILRTQLDKLMHNLEQCNKLLQRDENELEEATIEFLARIEEIKARNAYVIESVGELQDKIESKKKEIEKQLKKEESDE